MNEKDLEAFRDLIDSIHPSYKSYSVSYLKEIFPQEFQAFEAGCSHSKKEGQAPNKELEELKSLLATSEELSDSKDEDLKNLKSSYNTALKTIEGQTALLKEMTTKLESTKKLTEELRQELNLLKSKNAEMNARLEKQQVKRKMELSQATPEELEGLPKE
jgi:chromosome segregation ATPase